MTSSDSYGTRSPAPAVHTALPAVNNSRASGDMRTTYLIQGRRVGTSFHSRLITNRTLPRRRGQKKNAVYKRRDNTLKFASSYCERELHSPHAVIRLANFFKVKRYLEGSSTILDTEMSVQRNEACLLDNSELNQKLHTL